MENIRHENRILSIKMKTFSQLIILIVLNAIILMMGCSSRNSTAGTSTGLPWAEAYGRFYTKDVDRALSEIPFPIIFPSYVPKGISGPFPPDITGPLKGHQYDNKVKVEVLYIVDLGNGKTGTIRIYEQNYNVKPLDPKLEYAEIKGVIMSKIEGTFQEGTGVVFFFNQGGIYFEVGVYDFTSDEATKIIESMII